MKQHIQHLLQAALQTLHQQSIIQQPFNGAVHLEYARDKQHGDFASNLALVLAKHESCAPRVLAEKIVGALPTSHLIQKTEIAGPGFINFFLTPQAWQVVVNDIREQGVNYGQSNAGLGKKILVEFVSSNPTGPLHVGHGRAAAYGSVVSNLLEAVGYEVHREYYVNDAGRQMDILSVSVWLRYLEQCGEVLVFPSNAYQADYVKTIAQHLKDEHSETFYRAADVVFQGVPPDEPAGGNKELHVDALIHQAKSLLGDAHYSVLLNTALTAVLDDIKNDLFEFNVYFQHWFSERSLIESGAVDRVIHQLKNAGCVYERDGAWWFRATAFGDDKDRVLIRENSQLTYFATDIAYHLNKLERGFDRMINVLGADHHGYAPRLRAVVEALGYSPDLLTVVLIQLTALYRGKEKVRMSTRKGEFITFRALREEVGVSAARFFYIFRSVDQPLDFDVDLAKSRSIENPVYYVQYAHARICSVIRKFEEAESTREHQASAEQKDSLSCLVEPSEINLLKLLNRYVSTLENAAMNYAPHLLAHYLRDLAQSFHIYYNDCAFLVEESTVRYARLALISATRQVIANGLNLLGIAPVESM